MSYLCTYCTALSAQPGQIHAVKPSRNSLLKTYIITKPRRRLRLLALNVHNSSLNNAAVGLSLTSLPLTTNFFVTGASGFYALNAHNSWLNNAAVGGFSGFTFPNAPRAIKDSKDTRDAAGYPFVPSSRPLIAFRGNSARGSGYQWEHGACFYFGGERSCVLLWVCRVF